MSRISSDLFQAFRADAGGFGAAVGTGSSAEARSRRQNRRRAIVFLSVFAALTLVGLGWVFARPAIYQATAQLNFVPATGQGDDAAAAAATNNGAQPASLPNAASGVSYSLRDEIQYLTSRKLLGNVWNDLKDLADTPSALRTADAPATLQTMLTASQVAGTNIVAIEAHGRDPAFLAALVDRVITDYQAGLDDRFKDASTTELAEARDEERILATTLAEKRAAVDTFRLKYNIVSLDRDENQVLTELKGTGTALNLANEKVVAAEGRLTAMKDAQAQGRTVVRARDNPTLAALEQQAIAVRADLSATARQFTEQYMTIDPRVRQQRARLADIEEQIAAIRKDSQAGAIQEGQEEVAATRAAATALRQQLATNQGTVQNFTSRLNEYRTLDQQIVHVQLLHQRTQDRIDLLEAGERARKPKVQVVEPPSIPQSPSSPQYARDAAIVVFASLLIGLVTMGIVELFNRSPQQASTIVVPQTWAPIGMAHPDAVALSRPTAYGALPDAQAPTAALPAPLPRELDDHELAALLAAADPHLRSMIALLLTGLTPEEVVGLKRGDLDRETGTIAIAGRDPRAIRVPAQVVAALPAASAPAEAPLLTMQGDRPCSTDDLKTALLYAAHDAGIDAADDVTPETLRHTYVAFLLRQGLRFADVARLVGPLASDRLAAYKQLAPAGVATTFDAVERILPALRDAA